MLSGKTLKLLGTYFGYAHSIGFTPFPWNRKEHCFFVDISSGFHRIVWWFWLFLIQGKFVYLLIQFGRLWTNGNMGHLIFHIYFLMPTCLAAVVQFDFCFKLKDFPYFFRRVRRFSDSAKEIYMPECGQQPVVSWDGLEPLIYFGFVMNIASAVGIFGLGLSSTAEKMPQLFYSAFVSMTGWNDVFWIRLLFSILEAFIIALSWTSCMFHAILIPALSICFIFWTQKLRDESMLEENLRIPEKLNQLQKTYRELQILDSNLNQSLNKMVATIFATAFANQVAANYSTLCLYNSMSLVTWGPCPILAVGGLNTLVEMQKFFGHVYETSEDLLHNCWDKIRLGSSQEQEAFLRFKRSCQALKITQGDVYYFKKESAHMYVYAIFHYTMTFLFW